MIARLTCPMFGTKTTLRVTVMQMMTVSLIDAQHWASALCSMLVKFWWS